MYVCIYVSMYVRMYAYTHTHIAHVCIYTYMHTHIYRSHTSYDSNHVTSQPLSSQASPV